MRMSLLHRLRNTAALASVALPLLALAQGPQLSPQFDRCMSKADGVTFDMMECIGQEVQRQDARLNKAYKVLMVDLSPERKKQLREAQRAWLRFRDTNCDFYYDPNGGSSARLSGNDCIMTMTAERAKELEDLTP